MTQEGGSFRTQGQSHTIQCLVVRTSVTVLKCAFLGQVQCFFLSVPHPQVCVLFNDLIHVVTLINVGVMSFIGSL